MTEELFDGLRMIDMVLNVEYSLFLFKPTMNGMY